MITREIAFGWPQAAHGTIFLLLSTEFRTRMFCCWECINEEGEYITSDRFPTSHSWRFAPCVKYFQIYWNLNFVSGLVTRNLFSFRFHHQEANEYQINSVIKSIQTCFI